jgi:DNA polymerase-3 subunit epsilon
MELKLNQSAFDLETTGIDVGKDRIVEISIFKVFPNGNESKTWLVNPISNSGANNCSTWNYG